MGTRKKRLAEAVLTSTHNLCFEQNEEKHRKFLSENFHFLVVKFSVYLNRHVFVMQKTYNLTFSVINVFADHMCLLQPPGYPKRLPHDENIPI